MSTKYFLSTNYTNYTNMRYALLSVATPMSPKTREASVQ